VFIPSRPMLSLRSTFQPHAGTTPRKMSSNVFIARPQDGSTTQSKAGTGKPRGESGKSVLHKNFHEESLRGVPVRAPCSNNRTRRPMAVGKPQQTLAPPTTTFSTAKSTFGSSSRFTSGTLSSTGLLVPTASSAERPSSHCGSAPTPLAAKLPPRPASSSSSSAAKPRRQPAGSAAAAASAARTMWTAASLGSLSATIDRIESRAAGVNPYHARRPVASQEPAISSDSDKFAAVPAPRLSASVHALERPALPVLPAADKTTASMSRSGRRVLFQVEALNPAAAGGDGAGRVAELRCDEAVAGTAGRRRRVCFASEPILLTSPEHAPRVSAKKRRWPKPADAPVPQPASHVATAERAAPVAALRATKPAPPRQPLGTLADAFAQQEANAARLAAKMTKQISFASGDKTTDALRRSHAVSLGNLKTLLEQAPNKKRMHAILSDTETDAETESECGSRLSDID